jgi:hypothetical protein
LESRLGTNGIHDRRHFVQLSGANVRAVGEPKINEHVFAAEIAIGDALAGVIDQIERTADDGTTQRGQRLGGLRCIISRIRRLKYIQMAKRNELHTLRTLLLDFILIIQQRRTAEQNQRGDTLPIQRLKNNQT